jgi:hypothetical protein
MKLRRLMQVPSRTKPTKGSVVRHSKIAPPMTLWVMSARSTGSQRGRHFRFASDDRPKSVARSLPYRRALPSWELHDAVVPTIALPVMFQGFTNKFFQSR